MKYLLKADHSTAKADHSTGLNLLQKIRARKEEERQNREGGG